MRHPFLAACAGLAALAAAPSPLPAADGPDPHVAGLTTIARDDLLADIVALASAPLEGRDSPSVGLDRAADHIAARFRAAGLQGVGEDGSFRLSFTRELPAPLPEGCALEVEAGETDAPSGPGGDRDAQGGGDGRGQGGRGGSDDETAGGAGRPDRRYTFGRDFVPVWGADGEARGELVFLGFGIRDDGEKYNELRGDLSGTIALVLEGEPRHRRRFEGPEVTAAAELYRKLQHLQAAGVAGALVVRRDPEGSGLGEAHGDVEPPAPATLGFRHTWARWATETPARYDPIRIPALEIPLGVASELLGQDVAALAERIDEKARPLDVDAPGVRVRLAARSALREVPIDNVVGILPGSDPELAGEYVVIGAHYDHMGVDARGRIAFGADDNASGTATLLEVVEALAAARPRRSILACAFAAEEDGLAGSRAFCGALPVPRAGLAAMVNLDMVGRGDADELVAIGTLHNPGFDKVLTRAQKLSKTGVRKVVTRQGQELFARSDHYPFHELGVPALFFFEGLPLSRNPDYHTWQDTIDRLDLEKIEHTARFTYNTVWILANDDERLPPPGR